MSIREIMKKIILLILSLSLSLMAKDIVVYENEYLVLPLEKSIKKLIIGNKEIINVSMLNAGIKSKKMLKIFGKKSGNTSILLVNRDGSLDNYHVYVNQNLGYIQKMINVIEPDLYISKVGDGSTVISGTFKDPHEKKRIYSLLEHAGIDLKTLMDVTQTNKINKMIRTKLYLVQIDNSRAKDLGGVTGLGYFDDHLKIGINGGSENSATFSGWLLDNQGQFSTSGHSGLVATLNFLESKGIAKILDDTVLITTEDKNASFHVGGEVYIPVGMTQTNAGYPTIQLEEKEYGLRLTLTTSFLEKEGFMHMNISIVDSEFDPNEEHSVTIGVAGGTLTTDGEPIKVPSFISKHIDTDVVSKSGQLIALGGRLHTEDIDAEEKIPFLGDIPLLGALFTRNVKSTKQNDLLFFLVPEIIDANEDINDTRFYKEFKDDAANLHEVMLDMEDENVSEPNVKEIAIIEEDNETDIVVIEDASGNTFEDTKGQDSSEVIEIEDTTVELVDEVKNVEIEKKPVTKVVVAEEKIVPVEEIPEQIKEQEPTEEVHAAINISKIYIRSQPVDGRRAQVWIDGHKFTYNDEVEVDGRTWVKINKDCENDCVDVSEDLWVAKKYIK